MMFELVKNSLRAMELRFMDFEEPATTKIIIANGIEDVTIKVLNVGGIPRSGLLRIFTYLYSTANNPLKDDVDLGIANNVTIFRYGYRLRISHLYA
ncbi:hypothetical protein L6164_016714 [Bauhinia variegata]|uniref:Uncharacterized protein n=1 Tax=Bauhinia variegata TaxID=167791 RepID=A0ACB9N758_BAUVA|nr:hypothetical protein L6164_016714 [Bauhinia variegata]